MPVNTSLTEKLIPLADAHQAADEYIAGPYWDRRLQRGCAVGCTIHDAVATGALAPETNHDDHRAIAEATGLPEMCWWLADYIFEALALGSRPSWTPRFLRAALICRHPETVGPRIMARLAQRLAVEAIQPECRATAEYVAALWTRRANGDEPAGSEWEAARQQADAAMQQTDAAMQQHAYAARQQAKAARHQAYAARQQQAYAARQQADAAMQQAKAARHQADAMGPQAHTTSAWQQWWSWCADMVCEELRS